MVKLRENSMRSLHMSNYLWRLNNPTKSLWPDAPSRNGHPKTCPSSFLIKGLHISAIFNFTNKSPTRTITLKTSGSQRVSLTVYPSNAKLTGTLKSLQKRDYFIGVEYLPSGIPHSGPSKRDSTGRSLFNWLVSVVNLLDFPRTSF